MNPQWIYVYIDFCASSESNKCKSNRAPHYLTELRRRWGAKLFGICHTITPSNANYSVVFQFFTIPRDLSRGYKTKIITLPPKINTITSNEEKNMNMSMEMLNSFNTCSNLRILFFVKIYDFGWKMRFLLSLKVIFVKNPKFHWKASLWVRKLHTKFQGNISTNNIAIFHKHFHLLHEHHEVHLLVVSMFCNFPIE